jgi:hypothetical protein
LAVIESAYFLTKTRVFIRKTASPHAADLEESEDADTAN